LPHIAHVECEQEQDQRENARPDKMRPILANGLTGDGPDMRAMRAVKRDTRFSSQIARHVRAVPPSDRSQVLASFYLAGVLALVLLLFAFNVGDMRQRLFGSSGANRIESIAVLPFTNLSDDPKTEYLSDGITESLINSLSQLPNLAVMSRNTVFRYKTQTTDPQKIARTCTSGPF